MKLKTVCAKKLAHVHPDVLWERLKGTFILRCDDGDITVREKDALYSTYMWEFFRRYPDTPFLKSHVLKTVVGNEAVGAKTHIKLCRNILFSVFDAYRYCVPDQIQLLDDLARLGYECGNAIYNNLTINCESYVASIDILDFAEIAEQPNVVSQLNRLHALIDDPVKRHMRDELEKEINECYKIITKNVRDPVLHANNPLAMAAKAGIVSIDQLRQCVGPRGFLPDVNSMIFSKPIIRGFYHGLRSLSDMMMESRSASLSLNMQQDPLRHAEYFSRRIQLVCMNLKRIHYTDCGSTNYLVWRVRGEETVDGKVTHKSDLNTIAGQWYMDDDNQLKVIQKTDTHLIGKYVRLRNIVAGCNHPDPSGVCVTCFGESGWAIPSNTNLGHVSAVRANQDMTQIVLSTKHFIGSSSVGRIILDEVSEKFMHTQKNFLYYLNEEIFKTYPRIRLIVAGSDAPGITDPKMVDNVRVINVRRVGEFKSVAIETTDINGIVSIHELKTYVDNRVASFTHEMLELIQDVELEVTAEGAFVIDISNWECEKPFLELTMRHFNMSDHQKAVEAVIEGTAGKMIFNAEDLLVPVTDSDEEDDDDVAEDTSETDSETSSRPEVDLDEESDGKEPEADAPKKRKRGPKTSKRRMTPQEVLVELHDTINTRMSVSLSILSAIVYSYSIVSSEDFDMSLPKPWTAQEYGQSVAVHELRSLGSAMAFERHQYVLVSPLSFLIRNRPNHPFDHILCGEEIQRIEQQHNRQLDC